MPAVELQGNTEEANQALLQRCQRNDPDACRELFSQYNRRIFNTAYRILGEESSAEDALQETLLNVYKGLGRFRGESKVATWISRITINVCLGMLRKGKSRKFVDLDDESAMELPAESTPYLDPLQHTSMDELRTAVNESFRRMTQKQSEVVRLHDLEGHTIEEIAELIQCPVGTVKSRLFYGRQEFKDVFTALMSGARFKPATVN